jgi:hypothetical protein
MIQAASPSGGAVFLFKERNFKNGKATHCLGTEAGIAVSMAGFTAGLSKMIGGER